jgi:hypothetical protein
MKVPEVSSPDASTQVCQRLFESAYVKGLRDATARRAREYAKLWPELVEQASLPRTVKRIVRLRGFDPEELQYTYIPFRNAGPATHEQLCELMREMGEKAKAA